MTRNACTWGAAALLLAAAAATSADAPPPGQRAAKPLFRDPVFDGAADSAVVWNPRRL